VYCADPEAWLEICTIYFNNLDFKQAQHAFEEVLLSDPSNPALISKLAEILYAVGTEEALVEARKYFSRSLSLLGDGNTRALWGLYMATAKLGSLTKLQRSDDLNIGLRNESKAKLEAEYSKSSPSLSLLLKPAIDV